MVLRAVRPGGVTYASVTRSCGAPIQRRAAPTARRALEGNTNTNLQEDGGEHGGEHWYQRGVHRERDDGHVLVAECVQRVLHHCRSKQADIQPPSIESPPWRAAQVSMRENGEWRRDSQRASVRQK